MGIITSKSEQKNTTILPRFGNGPFEVGCAEIMVNDNENGDDDIGILSTIYYPSDKALASDVRNF